MSFRRARDHSHLNGLLDYASGLWAQAVAAWRSTFEAPADAECAAETVANCIVEQAIPAERLVEYRAAIEDAFRAQGLKPLEGKWYSGSISVEQAALLALVVRSRRWRATVLPRWDAWTEMRLARLVARYQRAGWPSDDEIIDHLLTQPCFAGETSNSLRHRLRSGRRLLGESKGRGRPRGNCQNQG